MPRLGRSSARKAFDGADGRAGDAESQCCPEGVEKMMYSCAPGSRGSAAVVKTKRRKSLRVDIHCHYLNPDAAARVAPLNPAQHEAQIQFANALTREVNAK